MYSLRKLWKGGEMKVFELRLKVYLLQNIQPQDSLNLIALFIDGAMSKEEKWLEFHKENKFKNYNFCSFYPVEREGAYKEGNIYTVIIRTIDPDLADYFQRKLQHHSDISMKGLTCDIKEISKRPIEKIYSLTPVLLKDMGSGYWKGHLKIEEFEERIKVNLVKKWNAFTSEKINEAFCLHNTCQFINRIPIKIPYKDITLLGDKIELQISTDKEAQELAYMSLGTGIGESNARGLGFVNCKYYK